MPQVKPEIEAFARIRVVGVGGSGNKKGVDGGAGVSGPLGLEEPYETRVSVGVALVATGKTSVVSPYSPSKPSSFV